MINNDEKIRVIIAEDRTPIRKRYEKILNSHQEISVIASVSTGADAITKSLEQIPDIVLMDIEMETRTAGLIATRSIIEAYPEIKIIILTVFKDEETVLEAFQLGAADYILKDAPPEDVIKSVRENFYGIAPIRPEIADKLRNQLKQIKKYESTLLLCLHIISQLTPAEKEVIALLGHGYKRTQICKIRYVELSTLKSQINSILKKFNCRSVADVISMLRELKLFDEFFKIDKK